MAGGNFQWVPDVTAGVNRNHALSKRLRFASIAATKSIQFTRVEQGYGKHMGESVTINRVRNTDAPTSAVLNQSGKVPIDPMAMSTRTITVSEFGRGIGYTSLAQLLNTFDPRDAIQKTLKKQMKLTLDVVCMAQFKNARIRYAPTGAAAGTFGTPGSTTATHNLNVYHVKRVRDYMVDTIHVEPYEADYYMALCATLALRGVKDDSAFNSWRRYLQPDEAFYNGEAGMIELIRMVEVNNDKALGKVGTGSALGECVFFGDDPVALIEAEAPELRAAFASDFGRQQAIAWYGVLAFGNVWDTANDGEANIVHVTG